jgi:hypothetical protein
MEGRWECGGVVVFGDGNLLFFLSYRLSFLISGIFSVFTLLARFLIFVCQIFRISDT